MTTVSSSAAAPTRTWPSAPACRCAFSSTLTRIRNAPARHRPSRGGDLRGRRPPSTLVVELVERRADDLVHRPQLRASDRQHRPRAEKDRAGRAPSDRDAQSRSRSCRRAPTGRSRRAGAPDCRVLRRPPRSRSAAIAGRGRPPEHVRLDRVASPQRLGLECLSLELLAIDRNGEERCQRRKEAAHHLARRRVPVAASRGSRRSSRRPRGRSHCVRATSWPLSPRAIHA